MLSAKNKTRESASLLIKGGHLIDPAAKINTPMDILLRDCRVAEVALPGKIRGGADDKFDARGLIVAPAFIALPVHLRQPGQAYKKTTPTAPPPTAPPSFAALQRVGAVAVTADGKPILDDDIMRMALRLSAELNLPVVQPAEDTRLTEGCSMHAGPTSFRLGLRAMPASAEAAIVDRDVMLAQQIRDSRLHVAHLSTSDALKAVRRGKRGNHTSRITCRVTCELTPHHFTLLDENVGEYDTNFKMNPPLRSAADLEAILVALADGTVDAIATDHAPHAAHEKQVEFERASFGITGLETALALAITQLHAKHKISLALIVELFTAGPARA